MLDLNHCRNDACGTPEKKYKVLMKYSDGSVVEEDGAFDSKKSAKKYADYMVSCTDAGAVTMYWSNPGVYPLDNYNSPEYKIIEAN